MHLSQYQKSKYLLTKPLHLSRDPSQTGKRHDAFSIHCLWHVTPTKLQWRKELYSPPTVVKHKREKSNHWDVSENLSVTKKKKNPGTNMMLSMTPCSVGCSNQRIQAIYVQEHRTSFKLTWRTQWFLNQAAPISLPPFFLCSWCAPNSLPLLLFCQWLGLVSKCLCLNSCYPLMRSCLLHLGHPGLPISLHRVSKLSF